MAAGLEVRNLTKVFGNGGERVVAVDDVSFAIRKGVLFSLLGESGCGKTTTLRMVAGLERVTGGSILFSGEDVTHLPPNRRGIGMVFQSYALYPHMTVLENVAYGLRVRGVGKKESAARVAEALDIVDLPAPRYASRRPSELSGGQQQRVALARSLVYNPRLLLFDEPLSNLDAKLKVYMREEIRKVQQRSGITAIYVTHDQEEALAISDHVAVMFKGVIEQVGTPVEVYDQPATVNVANFIGRANLFPAMLTGHDGPHALAETSSGETIRGTVCNKDLQPDSLVTVMIRPERIRMAASQPVLAGIEEGGGDEANVVAARVKKLTYLGNRTRYVLQSRFGADLTVDSVRMIEGAVPESGVTLSFEPGEVLFLPFSEEAQ